MDLKRNFDLLSSENRIGDDIKTVDDLLAWDDVNHILGDLVKAKKDIKRLVVVWEDDQGELDWRASNMRMSKVIGLLEMTKTYIIMDNSECYNDDERE